MTNTVEDFENAPFAATATRDDGLMAVKIDDGERSWLTPVETYLDDEEMMVSGYTLDRPAPTTPREALDLAWELAHEVKPGQVLPEGTHYLEVTASGVKEYVATCISPTDLHDGSVIRTLEPLPEPDWLDAPAVLAVHDSRTKPAVWGKHWDQDWLPGYYQSALTAGPAHWSELRDVTPLYPKEGQDA